MTWDWGYVSSILPTLLVGLRLTVEITLIASAGAFILGVPVVLLARARSIIARAPTRFVMEFIRGTPLIIQAFFAFYVFPSYGLKGSPIVVGTAVLAVNYTPYIAEASRAGVESIARGQWEAAHALQLSRTRTWSSIILPPAIRRALPPLIGYVIAMYKDTAALFVIGIPVLFGAAQSDSITSFRFLEPYTLAGFFYFVVSYASSILLRRLERRYD